MEQSYGTGLRIPPTEGLSIPTYLQARTEFFESPNGKLMDLQSLMPRSHDQYHRAGSGWVLLAIENVQRTNLEKLPSETQPLPKL